MLTLQQQADLAKQLGHRLLEVEEKPAKVGGMNYWCHCACGYSCSGRRTYLLAVSAQIHHMRAEAKKYELAHLRNGVAIPGNVRPAV